MDDTLDFPALLHLIDERSAAFRAAVAAAPDLGAQVPTCPEWTLTDLVHHLGEGRYSWAATVAAGPDAPGRVPFTGPAAPDGRAGLVDWLAASHRALLDALRAAGPERGCWAWWDPSQSPRTSGTVARHQLQQVAVHTYDAQLTAGAQQPLPAEVALDGVTDFLLTCCATTSPWPHEPAVVHYHATEGRSWRVALSPGGAWVDPLDPATAGPADASATGTAHDLVLFFYGRIPMDALKLDGDRRVFDRLIAWEPA